MYGGDHYHWLHEKTHKDPSHSQELILNAHTASLTNNTADTMHRPAMTQCDIIVGEKQQDLTSDLPVEVKRPPRGGEH